MLTNQTKTTVEAFRCKHQDIAEPVRLSESRVLICHRTDQDAIGDSPLLIYLAGAGVTLKASIRIFQSSPSRITDQ